MQNTVQTGKNSFILQCRDIIRIWTINEFMNLPAVHMMQKNPGSAVGLVTASVAPADQYHCAFFRFPESLFFSEFLCTIIGLKPASEIQYFSGQF